MAYGSVGLSVHSAVSDYLNDSDGWDYGEGFREVGKVGADFLAASSSM